MIFVSENRSRQTSINVYEVRAGVFFGIHLGRPVGSFQGMPTGAALHRTCTTHTIASVHIPVTGLHVIPAGVQSNTLFPSLHSRLWRTSGTTFDLSVEE